MKTATALVKLYEEFSSARIKYLGTRAQRSVRYFFKTISLQKAYMDILEKEHDYHKECYVWIDGYIERNHLTVKQLKNASTTFQLFREELSGKNLFLIVFMVLLGVTGSMYSYLSEHLGAYSIVIGINWFFGLLAVMERARVVWHITISNQLQILLDKWVAEHVLPVKHA